MKISELKGLVIHGWDLLRKPTTPVHILYGLWCGFMMYAFGFLVGFVFLAGFAKWEVWNDHNEMARKVAAGQKYVYEGDWDFWESVVPLCVGLTPMGILQVLGIVSIAWL